MLDLEAIKARCELATPGPWEARDGYVWRGDTSLAGTLRPADASFAAAARTDVPALVAEVERLLADTHTYTKEGILFCAICGTALGDE